MHFYVYVCVSDTDTTCGATLSTQGICNLKLLWQLILV